MAVGWRRRISSSGRENGWISEYTASSRIRRAMSCVYCEPKSRIRTTWRMRLLRAVVGGFLGDDDAVNVALAQAGRADAHELRLGAQLVDGAAAGVAHARAQTAEELVDRLGEPAAVGHAPLDALGDQLAGLGHLGLEVAVLGAGAHGAQRAHAAVDLVAAPLVEDDLARRLVGAGEERADHHRVGPGGERLDHVARLG